MSLTSTAFILLQPEAVEPRAPEGRARRGRARSAADDDEDRARALRRVELQHVFGPTFGVPRERLDGIHWRNLWVKNLCVHTSVNPDFARDFPLAMRWINEGRVDVSPIITHRYPLEQIQTAFDTFRHRRDGALKVFVDFPKR